MTAKILIVYYSLHGSTKMLANEIALGVESTGCESVIRTVPKVLSELTTEASLTNTDLPLATKDDLMTCDALILGSPCRFGNSAASIKFFLDSTSDIWLSGKLSGKPFGLFTSTSTLHGGQETTLLSMALPLIHHGMLWVGLPATIPAFKNTKTGGSYYGATHVHTDWNQTLSKEEKIFANELGQRVAQIAIKLKN